MKNRGMWHVEQRGNVGQMRIGFRKSLDQAYCRARSSPYRCAAITIVSPKRNNVHFLIEVFRFSCTLFKHFFHTILPVLAPDAEGASAGISCPSSAWCQRNSLPSDLDERCSVPPAPYCALTALDYPNRYVFVKFFRSKTGLRSNSPHRCTTLHRTFVQRSLRHLATWLGSRPHRFSDHGREI